MTQGVERKEEKKKNAKTRFNAETVLAKRKKKKKVLTKMLLLKSRNVV